MTNCLNDQLYDRMDYALLRIFALIDALVGHHCCRHSYLQNFNVSTSHQSPKSLNFTFYSNIYINLLISK